MKVQTLKRNKNKKYIIGIIVFIAVLSTISLVGSRAKYRTTQSIKLAEGKINYTLGDVNTMAVYIKGDSGYERVDAIPESGYEFNQTESYCNIGTERQDVTISYDMSTKTFTVAPYTQGKMKCYLYFDEKKIPAKDYILANTSMGNGTPNFVNTSCSSGCNEATNGLYTAEDNKGTSYYFRGTIDNNWVKFGKNSSKQDIYWRIIRINGNETIRLIYNGTTTTMTETQTTASAFSSGSNNNMYVGYMYTQVKTMKF